MDSRELTYRPDIDGLRAVAIVSVVAYHIHIPIIPGGFTGVDVFFVISGYLITKLLLGELEETGSVSILSFYARRVVRLFPALAVVLIFTLLASALLVPLQYERTAVYQSGIASAFFLSNEYFRQLRGGYFGANTDLMPLLHFWSLSVEEQFYLLWPLILLCVGRWFKQDFRGRLFQVFIVIAIASFLLNLVLMGIGQRHAFYFIGARAWELAIGGLLVILEPRLVGQTSARIAVPATFIGAFLVLLGFLCITPETAFPGYAALIPVTGTALVIWGSGHSAGWVRSFLSAPAMVWIGKLSYGWYLWHWPILALARGHRMDAPNVWLDSGLAGLALFLAWLSLRYLEQPVRRMRSRHLVPSRSVVLAGFGVVVFCTTLSLALLAIEDHRLPNQQEEWAMKTMHDYSSQHWTCGLSAKRWRGTVPNNESCELNAERGGVELAIWGDSHAGAWAPALQSSETGYVQLSMHACPPVMGVIPKVSGVSKLENCPLFNQAVMDFLSSGKSENIKGVILASRWTAYIDQPNIPVGDDWIGGLRVEGVREGSSLLHLRQGLSTTLQGLSDIGLRVLLILNHPEFKYPPHRCLMLKDLYQCGVSRKEYLSSRQTVSQLIFELAEQYPNVRVIDPIDFFCDEMHCPAVKNGTVVLYDDDHVAASFAQMYGSTIYDDLVWLYKRKPAKAVQE